MRFPSISRSLVLSVFAAWSALGPLQARAGGFDTMRAAQAGKQLTLEWHQPASSVLASDPAIEVLQLTPTLRLRGSTAQAQPQGRTFSARFALPQGTTPTTP